MITKNANAMVILNKYPYNSAHCLVLPTRHIGELEKLSKPEAAALHEMVRSTVVVLKKVYQPQGINIGLNLGKAAGAGLPEHIHYHIIPRWAGDLNFFPLVAESKVVAEDLIDSLKRLREGFGMQKKRR